MPRRSITELIAELRIDHTHPLSVLQLNDAEQWQSDKVGKKLAKDNDLIAAIATLSSCGRNKPKHCSAPDGTYCPKHQAEAEYYGIDEAEGKAKKLRPKKGSKKTDAVEFADRRSMELIHQVIRRGKQWKLLAL